MSEWLDVLEAKVHEAAETLRQLRDRNRELEIRTAELEEQLAAAEAAVAGAGTPGDGDEGARAWEEERDEIRRRVEKLTAGLEELVKG